MADQRVFSNRLLRSKILSSSTLTVGDVAQIELVNAAMHRSVAEVSFFEPKLLVEVSDRPLPDGSLLVQGQYATIEALRWRLARSKSRLHSVELRTNFDEERLMVHATNGWTDICDSLPDSDKEMMAEIVDAFVSCRHQLVNLSSLTVAEYFPFTPSFHEFATVFGDQLKTLCLEGFTLVEESDALNDRPAVWRFDDIVSTCPLLDTLHFDRFHINSGVTSVVQRTKVKELSFDHVIFEDEGAVGVIHLLATALSRMTNLHSLSFLETTNDMSELFEISPWMPWALARLKSLYWHDELAPIGHPHLLKYAPNLELLALLTQVDFEALMRIAVEYLSADWPAPRQIVLYLQDLSDYNDAKLSSRVQYDTLLWRLGQSLPRAQLQHGATVTARPRQGSASLPFDASTSVTICNKTNTVKLFVMIH